MSQFLSQITSQLELNLTLIKKKCLEFEHIGSPKGNHSAASRERRCLERERNGMEIAFCSLKHFFPFANRFGEGATPSSRNVAARTPVSLTEVKGPLRQKNGSAERAISRRSLAPTNTTFAFGPVFYLLSVRKTKPSIEISNRKMSLCFSEQEPFSIYQVLSLTHLGGYLIAGSPRG